MIADSAITRETKRQDNQFPIGGVAQDLIRWLRRELIWLALEEDDPVRVLKKSTLAVSRVFGCPCSFVEGNVVSDTAPWCTVAVVRAGGMPMGALLIGGNTDSIVDFDEETIHEIADLVGLCVFQAQQASEIVELQNESEDMLFLAPDAIFVIEENGSVSMANRRALDMINKETTSDVVGLSIYQLLGPAVPDLDALIELAHSGGRVEIEVAGQLGRIFASLDLSTVGESEQILCVARDITQERQAQLALRRNERSSLLGETVEYLLHEINNPLAALLSNIGLAQKCEKELKRFSDEPAKKDEGLGKANGQMKPPSDKVGLALSNASTAGMRIRKVMNTLRSAHHGASPTGPDSIDVGFEIGLALSAAEAESRGSCSIVSTVGVLPRVQALPLQLAEAFVAVIKNAVQAVQKSVSGCVVLRTDKTDDEIRVIVEDNGMGVPDDLKSRIFMPFFTTKPFEDAYGLGLTMADDTIRNIGGSIRVEDVNPVGARFVVTLPVCVNSSQQ